MSIHLPNIKSLFLPDPGYEMFDVDLAGADAQVVAWEADDEDLKQAFRDGIDVHAKNATDMMGEQFSRLSVDDPKRKKLRKDNKQAVHGTNYGVKPPTMSSILGWTIHECEMFQRRWFHLHPKILEWQRRIDAQVRTTRRVTNKFGYGRTYFDRVDSILPEALAWVPQSTVALVCFHGALAVRKQVPQVRLLIQVHDSLVGQYPLEQRATVLPLLRNALHTPVPYSDPLTIPWGLSLSTKSWGDCHDAKWPMTANSPAATSSLTRPIPTLATAT